MVDLLGNIELSKEAEKLFKRSEWLRAMKAGLIVAGRDWIAGALPKRFTSFATTHLGYTSKKIRKTLTREEKIRIAISMMRKNGQYQRLVDTYCTKWGGWDPSSKGGPPSDVWRAWVKEALSSGRIKVSKTDEWNTARKKMRVEALEQTRIRERVRTFAIDEYVDSEKGVESIPLVDSGWLEKHAQQHARPEAKTKAGDSSLIIRIPRGNRQAAIVKHVLSQATEQEAQQVGDVLESQMVAFANGASVRKRGKRRATSKQKRRISSLINSAKTKGARARAHKNRQQSTHKNRA